jgi:hypothetical protein
MKKVRHLTALGLMSIVFHAGCGSDSETTTAANALAKAMPAVALTSPTASTATTLSFNQNKRSWFTVLQKSIGIRTATAAATATPTQGTMSQQLASNQNTLNQSAATVGATVSLTAPNPLPISCYGPSLTYAGSALPSGDLGLFSATEPPTTGTTACAAAQLNYLTLLMDPFNQIVKSIGTMLSAANAAGTSLPAIGASIDVTASMPTLGTNTVTSAVLSRLSNDASGNPVYKSVIAVTVSGSTATISVQHSPASDDNSKYSGNIQGILPYTDTSSVANLNRAISMNYSNDGTNLTFLAQMAANRTTASTDFFTSGMIDFTKSAFGEQGYMMLAKFNIKTNEATVRFAWQAGSGDGAIRAFEVQTVADANGLLSGYGYFGYGVTLSALSPSTAEWITKFYPQWKDGGGSGGPVISGSRFQGQTFAQSTVGGAFASTGFRGAFAPTSTGLATNATITGNTYFNTTTYTVSSLDFVTSGGLGVIGTVTPPTFTVQ